MELVGARHRTVVTILVNISYSLALIALSILVWYIRDWRTLALATALPFFGYFLFWWFLPESPRWLLAQGRFREAEEILKQIAKCIIFFLIYIYMTSYNSNTSKTSFLESMVNRSTICIYPIRLYRPRNKNGPMECGTSSKNPIFAQKP